MTPWVVGVSACAVLWCGFVVCFHPFRKGTHAAPRGLSPDVHDLTVPRATVALSPPWEPAEPVWTHREPGELGTWTPADDAWLAEGNMRLASVMADEEPCPGGCHEHYHYGQVPCECPCHADAEPAPWYDGAWLDGQLADLYTWVRTMAAS